MAKGAGGAGLLGYGPAENDTKPVDETIATLPGRAKPPGLPGAAPDRRRGGGGGRGLGGWRPPRRGQTRAELMAVVFSTMSVNPWP